MLENILLSLFNNDRTFIENVQKYMVDLFFILVRYCNFIFSVGIFQIISTSVSKHRNWIYHLNSKANTLVIQIVITISPEKRLIDCSFLINYALEYSSDTESL